MSSSIRDTIDALALGGRATIHGMSVERASLFGFLVGGASALCDAAEAARRCSAPPPRPPTRARAHAPAPARVEVCFRCGGDGLGRRDRGVCPVCHGSGVHVVAPASGWAGAPRETVARTVAQIAAALAKAPRERARRSLEALLAELTQRAA